MRPQQIFAILTKNMEKLIFDQLCYTVRKSVDNYYFCSDLLSWAKLLKNDFWSHLLNRAKMWKIATSIEFAIGSKSIQKFALNCLFDKYQFQNQVCHPCKPLEKVTAFLVFTHRANLRQIRRLPPLPSMQNYGRFDPTSSSKIE